MKIYKCECGAHFEKPRLVMESRGEFWGAPAYEDMWYCPICGDDCYEEVDIDENEVDDLQIVMDCNGGDYYE